MKKNKLILLFLFFVFIGLTGYGQKEEMLKLTKAIEENYSGFKVLNAQQQQAYLEVKQQALDSISTCKDANGQLKVVKAYLSFFKNNHLCAFTGDFMSFVINDLGFKMEPPTLTVSDSLTIILSIPSFIGSSKEVIDSLLLKYQQQLSKAKNLIIDIRGNRGGNDACFYSLMPYLYTNDFMVHEYFFLVTEKSLENYKNQFSPERFEKIKEKRGELVSFSDNKSEIFSEKWNLKVKLKPENIAIIVDRYVESSAEQFLFYAKQSRKVKIFGENTSGVLDCTNPDMLQFFNNNITVTIPTMISSRVWNRAAVENIGIQPDIYVPDMDKAVEFTKAMLSNW
jgi:hypothetical protein